MEFEYDPTKSASNKQKHGFDFEEAKALWKDGGLVEVPSEDQREPRWLAIAQFAGRYWTAIFARRGDAVRLISVRRSRDKEIERYEDENDRRG
jgi:uncharacterized DUF497 family protein